ncbi:MAG: signal peptide peptidase SppA [bacterium]
MSKKVIFWIVGVALVLILQISLFCNLILTSALFGRSGPTPRKPFEEIAVEGQMGAEKKVVIIYMNGLISFDGEGSAGESMAEGLLDQFEQARKDKNVAAVVVNIDSPGGEITASDALYEEIKRCDQVKPVVVYMNSVAASGAYYAAMGAHYIIANELCLTGSIGVILQTINYQKLADIIGVETVTFKSGKMKDLLSPARPITEEEKAYVQGMIMESYGKFLGIVAQRRGLDENVLREGLADGRVVSGRVAVQEKLVDEAGYLRDAITKARQLANLKDNALVVRYATPFRLGQLFRIFGKGPEMGFHLHLGPESLKLEAGKFYYLSPHLFGKF